MVEIEIKTYLHDFASDLHNKDLQVCQSLNPVPLSLRLCLAAPLRLETFQCFRYIREAAAMSTMLPNQKIREDLSLRSRRALQSNDEHVPHETIFPWTIYRESVEDSDEVVN